MAGGKGPALFHHTGIQVRESQVLQEGTPTQVQHRLHQEGLLLHPMNRLRPVPGETPRLLQGRLTEPYRDRPGGQQARCQQADQLHQDPNTIIQEDHIPQVTTTQGCLHVLPITTAGQLKTPQSGHVNTATSLLCVPRLHSLRTRALTSLLREGLNPHIQLRQAGRIIHTGAWNLQGAQDQLTFTGARAILLLLQEATPRLTAEAPIQVAAEDPAVHLTAADRAIAEEVHLTAEDLPARQEEAQGHLHRVDLQAEGNA
jgi:hypothetical protein